MDIKPQQPGVRVIDCRGPLCVVDDDESVRWAVTSLLQSMDFEAYPFSSGAEFLQSDLLDVCLCLISDVRMKKMSGFQLYEALTAAGKKIPVIFISGHADEHMRSMALSLGAAELLEKPFSDEVLLGLVENILARKSGVSVR